MIVVDFDLLQCLQGSCFMPLLLLMLFFDFLVVTNQAFCSQLHFDNWINYNDLEITNMIMVEVAFVTSSLRLPVGMF